MEPCNRLALQLDAEISAVITAMRQNAKWAVVPGKYNEEDQMEPEPHYEDFRALRRKIFDWGDWSEVQPLEFLAPFLKLVREPEVSGPITGVALTALWRLLSSGVLDVRAVGAAEAVNAIVQSTTQCKFEATSPASDEVVLFNILQVLQAVVRCEAGAYLSDESVCKAYQAAFMLGNLDADLRSARSAREVSELLTHYSRQIMGEITGLVFGRLQELEPGSPAADEAAAAGGVLPHISSVVAAAAAEAAAAKAAAAAEAAAAEAAAAEAAAAAAAAVEAEAAAGADGGTAAGGVPAAPAAAPAAPAAAGPEPRSPGGAAAVAAAAAAAAANASSGGASAAALSRQLSETVGATGHHHDNDTSSDACATFDSSSVHPGDLASLAADGSVGGARSSAPGARGCADPGAPFASGGVAEPLPPPLRVSGGAPRYGHGLPCAVEVLSFLIDCVGQRRADADGGGGDDEYAMFGLAMVHRAVLAGGAALAGHEALLGLLQRDLFAAMSAAAQAASLGVIAGVCQVLLAVWQVLGPVAMMQIEAVLQCVLLRLAGGKDTASPEQQEAALEGLLDLARCPGFLHAAFLSCDCRLERSNLFEDVAGLLSRTAFPGGGGSRQGLGPMHLISLDALLALLGALAERLDDPPPQLQPMSCPGRYIDVWGPVCRGDSPPLDQILGGAPASAAALAAAAAADAEAARGAAPSPHARRLSAGPGSRADRAGGGGAPAAAGAGAAGWATPTGPAAASAAEVAAFEKGLKQRVLLAVETFNRDYKKGFQFLQANKLLPELRTPEPEPAAAANGGGAPSPPPPPSSMHRRLVCSEAGVSEDELALAIGHFLRVCPGLNKTTIGELLGEPDQFFLKVLDAFTSTFDFGGLSFDAGLRTYLESFKLPGEAQKIDRIINTFGRAYYGHAPQVFANEDAAYVLAYSVIMLNTDRHNSQVKKKMEEAEFCRNLRGVNAGEDFPRPFLSAIYHSICSAPLRMSDTTGAPAVAGPASAASWAIMAERSATPRGAALVLPPAVRHCFDTMMFRLVWGQAVHAMGVVLEHADSDAVARAALEGLRTATRLAAHYDVEGVADSAVLLLAKFGAALHPGVPKPRVAFGRDAKARAALETLCIIATRYGDCVRSSWANVLDLVLRLDRLDLLPPALEALLDTDRRAAAGASRRGGGAGGGGFLRSVTQLIALQEPEYEAKAATQAERDMEAAALETLHVRCAIQEVFADSRFLKQEALQALVAAIIAAPGPLPRPLPAGAGHGHGGGGTPEREAAHRGHGDRGAPAAVDWEAAELCLDLLLVVLLRNRDRLSLLWPPVLDHLSAIIRGKGVDGALVAAGAVGLLRLCQRLLPCKPEAAEPLLRGLQLVPSLDPEVAWLNAEVIAAEMLALVQVASPHVKAQWAWASACNLIKMTSVRPEAFPVSLEALRWVVVHSLTPLNYVLALEASVWFIERAALEHPKLKERTLSLLSRLTAWLEGWAASLAGAGLSREQLLTFSNAKSEFWLYLVEMLARLAEHPDLQVRSAATAMLQQAAVSAEALGVLPGSIERGLRERLLPPIEALSRRMTGKAARDMPQADVTVSELVRVVSKAMLLHLPSLASQPGFAGLWTAVLGALQAAAGGGSEVAGEAAAAALQNLLIMLHDMGVLHPGWSDSQHNLWQHTWHVAHKVSPNLSPAMLSPAVNPARAAQQQAAAAAAALAGLPSLPLPQAHAQPGGVGVVEAAVAVAEGGGAPRPAA
ncbi:hypothetical protein HT031_004172 [Scenedesmus sp. PABB004]|nr:hypothetical protein HT031_004172 [Scenedesmus sp. PABB004]